MAPSSRRYLSSSDQRCASAEGFVCTAGCMTAHCPEGRRGGWRGDSAWRNYLPAWSDAPGFFWFPESMDPLQEYLAKPWLEFYQPGVPPAVEFESKPVFRLLDEAATRWPRRDALVFYGRGITYGELRDATDRLACAFADLGVKKGDRVALYLVNSPQFVIAYFAALKSGAVVTSISPLYTSHEVRYQLEDSGARVVVCQDVLYEKVAKCGAPLDAQIVTGVGEYLPPLKRLLAKTPLARLFPEMNLGSAQVPSAPGLQWLQDLLKKYPPRPPQVALDPDTDLAALPYTGGTTGHPKGVMLTHANMLAAEALARASFPAFVPGKEVVIAFLPFFHIYGQVVIMLGGLSRGDLLVLFTCSDTEA